LKSNSIATIAAQLCASGLVHRTKRELNLAEKENVNDAEKPINVIVSQLPERPPRPLFRDSSRLLALAAFLFSVVSGVYATYQTRNNSIQSAVESVSKLVDQYYDGQLKFAQLNSTQMGVSNLLRSSLRSTALRAITLANPVSKHIDEGTWLALALINDNENNFAAAKTAWKAAADNTFDATMYQFAMRGLAANLRRQRDIAESDKQFAATIQAALADKFKGGPNPLPHYYAATEAASTEAFWLSLVQSPDCSFIAKHFDAALDYIADAYQTALPTDYGYQNELLQTRGYLASFRAVRQRCSPEFGERISKDDCYAIADLVDNAPLGFSIYRGARTNSDPAVEEVYSRYYLPEATRCTIDAKFNLYCSWGENEETDTAERADRITKDLLACTNFTEMKALETNRSTSTRTTHISKLVSANRKAITIIRTLYKATDKRSSEWQVDVEILGPQVQ
jgi:hypothetical protein